MLSICRPVRSILTTAVRNRPTFALDQSARLPGYVLGSCLLSLAHLCVFFISFQISANVLDYSSGFDNSTKTSSHEGSVDTRPSSAPNNGGSRRLSGRSSGRYGVDILARATQYTAYHIPNKAVRPCHDAQHELQMFSCESYQQSSGTVLTTGTVTPQATYFEKWHSSSNSAGRGQVLNVTILRADSTADLS